MSGLKKLPFIAIPLLFLFSYKSFADTKRAAQVFGLCQQCHGVNGEGRKEIGAPSIAGMEEWYVLEQLKKFANGGRGTHHLDEGGLRMRPMAKTLRESDFNLVAKHVAELPVQFNKPTVEGNILRGKQLYATCAACHGPDGRGIRETNAPSIVNLDDWYLVKQLRHFKDRIRGYDPMKDPIGMTMYPMAMGLKDEQEMKDVITYVRALR